MSFALRRRSTLLVFALLIGASSAFVACGGDDTAEFHGTGGLAGAAGQAGSGGTGGTGATGGTGVTGGTGGGEAGDDVVSNGDAADDAMDDAMDDAAAD